MSIPSKDGLGVAKSEQPSIAKKVYLPLLVAFACGPCLWSLLVEAGRLRGSILYPGLADVVLPSWGEASPRVGQLALPMCWSKMRPRQQLVETPHLQLCRR